MTLPLTPASGQPDVQTKMDQATPQAGFVNSKPQSERNNPDTQNDPLEAAADDEDKDVDSDDESEDEDADSDDESEDEDAEEAEGDEELDAEDEDDAV